MARLTDLPNELVYEIIPHVQPSDLESFAQTCRWTASMAKPFLKEHRLLIRKYATYDAHDRTIDFSKLAENIAADPRIGHYIIHLICNGAHVLDYRIGDPRVAAFTALLDRLPNLNSLSIDEPHGDLVCLQSIFAAPDSIQATLSKLREFRLRSSGYQGVPLGLVQGFSVLPSMRLLAITNSGDIGDEGVIAPVQSSVSQLELWHCQIRAEELHHFLRGFTKLESFTYSGDRGGTDRDDRSTAFAIPSGLLCSKSSLKKLVWIAPGKPKCFMGSLTEFEALEELETESAFFGISHPKKNVVLQLPLTLKSLKVLHQVGRSPVGALSHLITRVIRWKSSHKAQLRKVELAEIDQWRNITTVKKSSTSLIPDLRKSCDAVGISLSIDGEHH